LQCLFVFVVVIGGILHDNGTVAFTDFAALLQLPLRRDLDPAWWRLRLGDEPPYIILRKAQDVSNSTTSNHYSTKGVRLLTSLGGRAAEYS
jgi:hypothetical protein